ncbi:MAG TPA: DUF1629 domain-containing protein [Verrucomicrobiae bacterium]
MKTKYYRLIQRSHTHDFPFIGDSWHTSDSVIMGMHPSDIRDKFDKGKEVLDWPDDFSFISSSKDTDGDLDDVVMNDLVLPVIGARLLKQIKTLKTPQFQTIPIDAISSEGKKERVFILNFTELIDCLDVPKSNVNRFPSDFSNVDLRGKIRAIWKPILIERETCQMDLFRCKHYSDAIFCSGRFKNMFDINSLTGVTFSPVGLV